MNKVLPNKDFANVIFELRNNGYQHEVIQESVEYVVKTNFCNLGFSLTGELQWVYNKFSETKKHKGALPLQLDSRPAMLLNQIRAYAALARLLSSNNVNGARHYTLQAKKCLALLRKEQEDVTMEFDFREVG